MKNRILWGSICMLGIMTVLLCWHNRVSTQEVQLLGENIALGKEQKRRQSQIIEQQTNVVEDLNGQNGLNALDKTDQILLNIISDINGVKLENQRLVQQCEAVEQEIVEKKEEIQILQTQVEQLDREIQSKMTTEEAAQWHKEENARRRAEEAEINAKATAREAENLNAYYDLSRFEQRDYSKVVYLTFDDGPYRITPKVLDVLDQYNVKATFFVTYTTYEAYVAYYKEIVDRGHAIGVHTASHVYSDMYANIENFKADFDKIYNWIYKHTGVYTTLYRFPGGSLNAQKRGILSEAKSFLRERGVMYYDWNVENGDGGTVTAEEAYFKVIDNIREKSHPIILMHDMKNVTVEALPSIIEQLLEWGYTFEPLTSDVKPVWQSS